MHPLTVAPRCPLPIPTRPSLWRRVADAYRASTLRDLDPHTLRDLGFENDARTQAELREAYRRFMPANHWHAL